MRKTRDKPEAHAFLATRGILEAWVVIRIDDTSMAPLDRGHFPMVNQDNLRGGFNVWPNEDKARAAAEWAAKKYGPSRMYGVFRLHAIVEQATPPMRVTEVV